MFTFKKRTPRSATAVAILASLAFLALAVWGWEVPLATVGRYFVISLLLIGAVMLAAIVMVLLLRAVSKLRHRD